MIMMMYMLVHIAMYHGAGSARIQISISSSNCRLLSILGRDSLGNSLADLVVQIDQSVRGDDLAGCARVHWTWQQLLLLAGQQMSALQGIAINL